LLSWRREYLNIILELGSLCLAARQLLPDLCSSGRVGGFPNSGDAAKINQKIDHSVEA
jgi:hypothetical protein